MGVDGHTFWKYERHPDCMCLDHVRGKHVGRSAVVLGSGPSLRHVDDRVRRHVTIAINDAVVKVPDPDYFFSSDGGIRCTTSWYSVQRGSFPVVILGYYGFPSAEEIEVEPKRVLYYGWRQARGEGILQMTPEHERLIWGMDGGHGAVNLAVIMGCSPIYLIGCDCQLEDGKDHFWEFPGQPSVVLRPPTERVLDLGDWPIGHTGEPYRSQAIERWSQLVAENPGLDIRDASAGRLQGTVRQVSMEELLVGI